MNNSYIINKNTLLIKSTIDKKGVVIELNPKSWTVYK